MDRRGPAADAAAGGSAALWPSERGPRIGSGTLHKRFCEYRDALGLDEGLDFHSLRRSYVTHLIEGGWDPLFVQQQAGHEHASTTSHLYLRVLGLPDPHAAAGAGRDGGRGDAAGTEQRDGGQAAGLLPVAAAGGDGRSRAVQRHRPGAAAGRPGHHLSSVQVWRLVTQTPERLSLPVLAALCDIFDVTPAQLIATRAENVPARRRASGGGSGGGEAGVTDLNALRPGPRQAAPRAVTAGRRRSGPAPGAGSARLPGRLLPRGVPVRPVPGHGACRAAGTCPGCGTDGPGAARPARRRADLPGLRRDHPGLLLPAVRHRGRHGPGYPAVAEAALRPVRGDLDGRPAAR